MNKIRRWKITYEQEFMGEIIKDSYEVYGTYYETEKRVEELYSDPHVINAMIEEKQQ